MYEWIVRESTTRGGGRARAAGGAAYCPALRSYVTERLARDAALMKERRKMKEERDLAKKATKGGGKNKDG